MNYFALFAKVMIGGGGEWERRRHSKKVKGKNKITADRRQDRVGQAGWGSWQFLLFQGEGMAVEGGGGGVESAAGVAEGSIPRPNSLH